MKNGIHFLLKKLNYDSGVMVSVRHLCRILETNGIAHLVSYYENEADLVRLVKESPYSCINLHVPSFSDETLKEILSVHDNVVLSIHSTMCNLQVEENSMERLLNFAGEDYKNLRVTCPSLCEVDGFNAVMGNEYIYLPNTFSYPYEDERAEDMLNYRLQRGGPKKISLISAYRPMKNMLTQAAAVIMLSKEMDVELHLVNSGMKSPVYVSLLKMIEDNHLPYVMHEQADNRTIFGLMEDFDLGLQVSLSETFSYVAFEHMIQGVPVIGSDSVAFSSEIVSYSNVNEMYEAMKKMLSDRAIYEQYAKEANRKARKVQQKNEEDALTAVRKMLTR